MANSQAPIYAVLLILVIVSIAYTAYNMGRYKVEPLYIKMIEEANCTNSTEIINLTCQVTKPAESCSGCWIEMSEILIEEGWSYANMS